ncbi:MAG TPA: hypothetical protein PK990_06240 [Salinivirgaceae bacterium]|nr:hypothetical protein [Salinivirgaceae bacterium]
MKEINAATIFTSIAIMAISIYVKWDYIKSGVVNATVRSAVGGVAEFIEYPAQTYNNSTLYTYTVDIKEHDGKYCNSELLQKLKCKRIKIKYSNIFQS